MQGIFAKWYQGDDLLRVYFTKWSAFRQAAVRQRLLDDLQKGSDDLAYHERIVAERQLILRKKREQIATLEAEYEAELKSCEALREAAASEAEHAKDVSEAKASLMKVARKLRQLVDALGSGLLRTTGTSLKQLAEAPDASSVLSIPQPFSSHDSAQEQKANEHGDDRRHRADDRLLLAWLKRTLGMLYEEDKSKHTLLHSADTVHEIVHLGMCLDLARCIPPRLRLQAEEKIPLGAVTEHMDLTTYNQDHIDIVASLMRVQTLCHGDIRGSALVRRGSALSLSPGASVASHQVASAQQDISSRFVDESLPVIAITEILDALEPEGPSDSTFLSVFLSQFFMASPLLPPLLSSEDALLQAIATIRSDFQRVTDLFLGEPLNQQRLQAQGGKSPRQLSLSRPTLANNTALFLQSETEEGAIASPLFQQNAQDEVELFLQNPESHIDAVIDIKCRLQETMRSVQLQSTKLRQDNSWESATRLAEAGVWNQLVAGVSVQTVAETENNKVKSERRKSSMTMKRRRSSGSSMSSRASHGSFVRKNGIILIMPGDVITIVEKAMQAHKLALDNVPDMILEYSKVLSILLDRYESPVDMIKEADLADLNDLSGKKYRSALNAVCSTENKTPLEIFIFALFFVADWQFDMAIEDNASADYIEVFRSRVLERLKQCSELTSGDLAVYTADQAALARQLFHRLRSKNAPVDQLSLANWKHLLDGNRWLTEKGCVTKQFLTDVFHKCNRAGEDCEKGAQGLTLTEFKRALMLVSHARFPGLFTSDKEKLAELFSFFGK
ncbi:Hypothetical Protein FCC1311_050532 [Hondaea fermentalgiana]|uniref:EF-hand domain-containing protein n=1 Tax=Hondaea fermentalgiana TaxID=2315210 RepID=A0A2R5GCY0_9STRA|nr:Hypothetical Protein FCC1311_050532 [Hondaea fermentalgiana]|eukprot:GBG28832.1 Hypothetical Protein FCC1311_050532 [Hondaea fermentalgiana]